jgi:hypothetical protein
MWRGLTRAMRHVAVLAAAVAAPSEVPAQSEKLTIAKLAIGDGVVIVNARRGGRVEVGAGARGHTVELALEAHAARQWADSTATILARQARTRRGKEVLYRSSVEEPGTSGAGMSFTRRVRGKRSVYRLFFADRQFGGFSIDVSRTETRALINALRKAAAVARRPRPKLPRPHHGAATLR